MAYAATLLADLNRTLLAGMLLKLSIKWATWHELKSTGVKLNLLILDITSVNVNNNITKLAKLILLIVMIGILYMCVYM